MIVAAVQVRMGSTRLPGKALADVVGKPMLWHILERLRFARRVDRVVIATTVEDSDAPIRAFAEAHGVPYFAGSERDLIDRLRSTCRRFGARALVRVTGDCPLVDPLLVDELVAAYLRDPDAVDCVTNTHPATYPDGLDLEVFPFSILDRLWNELVDPFWREWFTSYLTENRDAFRFLNLGYPVDLSALRWTVDYEEDLTFTREVFGRLHREGSVFTMKDVLALLEESPQLHAINSRHARNEGYAIALAAYRSTRSE